VSEIIGVGDGVTLGVCDERGVDGAERVDALVGVRTLGTKIRCPARIKVELPRQLANCSSDTDTPKAKPMWNSVSPGWTV
jgi:hypothetical protein